MANEITTSNDANLKIAAQLNQLIYMKIADKVDLRGTCTNFGLIDGSGSPALQVPQVTLNDSAASASEAAAVNPTALVDAKATITASRRALRYDLGDMMAIIAGSGGVSLEMLAGAVVDGAIRHAANVITTLYTGFANTAGTTGTALTVDTVYSAIFQNIQNDSSETQWSCVLKPKQMTDFMNSLRGEGNSVSYLAATADMLAIKPQGFHGRWMGVDFIKSNQVTDDSTDYSGALYAPGAIGYVEGSGAALQDAVAGNLFAGAAVAGSPIWVEFQRDSDKGLTEVVGNYYFGAAENEDLLGTEILSVM